MAKATQPKAAMAPHGADWCHLCGKRRKHTADVWYPENAEHDPPAHAGGPPVAGRNYIRVCGQCGQRIAMVACGLAEELHPVA